MIKIMIKISTRLFNSLPYTLIYILYFSIYFSTSLWACGSRLPDEKIRSGRNCDKTVWGNEKIIQVFPTHDDLCHKMEDVQKYRERNYQIDIPRNKEKVLMDCSSHLSLPENKEELRLKL